MALCGVLYLFPKAVYVVRVSVCSDSICFVVLVIEESFSLAKDIAAGGDPSQILSEADSSA